MLQINILFFCVHVLGVTDSVKKEGYRKKIAEFLDHAEKLKAHIEKEKEGRNYI